MSLATLFSFTLGGLLAFEGPRHLHRGIASTSVPMELQIQSLQIDAVSKVKSLDNIHLRATFNQKKTLEFGREQKWHLAAGQKLDLDIRIEIKPEWIQNDSLSFNLEIIESGLIETLAVRCATISKAVSSYNRAYHCTLPDETNALLTYRLATKNSVAPTNTMAKAEKN